MFADSEKKEPALAPENSSADGKSLGPLEEKKDAKALLELQKEVEAGRQGDLEELRKKIESASEKGVGEQKEAMRDFASVYETCEDHPEHNEDKFFSLPEKGIMGLFDGVGGAKDGERAASLVRDYIEKKFQENFNVASSRQEALAFLEAAMDEANQALLLANEREGSQGATTASVAMFRGNEVFLAAIGDSPAYVFHSNGELERLTLDDGFFRTYNPQNEASEWEIQKRLSSAARKEELSDIDQAYYARRNVIGRSFGRVPYNKARIYSKILKPGDRLLIFSDGLSDPVEDPKIAEIFKNNPDNNAALGALLEEAKDRNTLIGKDPRTGRRKFKHPRGKPDDKTGLAVTYSAEGLRKEDAVPEERSQIVKELENFLDDLSQETPEQARQSAENWIRSFGDLLEDTGKKLQKLLPDSIDARTLDRIEATYQEAIRVLVEKLGAKFLAPFSEVRKKIQEALNVIQIKRSELAKLAEKTEVKGFFAKVKGLFRRK